MSNPFTKDQWIQIWILCTTLVTIFITFWIGCIANAIANKQNSITEFQNSISQDQSIILRRQTEILEAQTSLIEEQTQISADALQFEKDKNFSDTAKEYREKMNILFDKITFQDSTLTAVHEKIIKGEEVQVDKNLDRYVNEFEDIGSLYCDWRIRFTDLKIILWKSMKEVCNSNQIFLHYQNTKSGISWMCSKLYSNSKMAKYSNLQKCVILRK